MTHAEHGRRLTVSGSYPSGLTDGELKVGRTMEFGASLIRLVDREQALADFNRRVREGALGFMAGNHLHHADMLNVNTMVFSMPETPRKTKFVIAVTLDEGDQGERLQRFTHDAKPTLAQNNIEYLTVYRGVQDDKYIHTEQRKAEIMATSNTNMRELFKEIRGGEELVIAAFLPGGVQAARKRAFRKHPLPWGRRFGTQKVPNNLLPKILNYADKIGRDVVVLPFTNYKTYRLIEVDKSRPTLYAKGIYVAKHLGIEAYTSSVIVHPVIGLDDFKNRGVDLECEDEVNNAAMRIIVSPLSKSDKGYYQDK